MSDLVAKRDRLLQQLRGYDSCAVAFSAGVDSSVLAKAAQLALGDQAVAVTAVSPSLASGELEQARELAELIGIRHRCDRDARARSGGIRRERFRSLLSLQE